MHDEMSHCDCSHLFYRQLNDEKSSLVANLEIHATPDDTQSNYLTRAGKQGVLEFPGVELDSRW